MNIVPPPLPPGGKLPPPDPNTFVMTIPEMEPYELKATKKQKEYIWNLGYKDQAVIDKLGKAQASAVIEQLKNFRQFRDAEASNLGAVFLAVGGIGIIFVLWLILSLAKRYL